jgi:ABC-type phosphate/phosphonate transport system permease subunit
LAGVVVMLITGLGTTAASTGIEATMVETPPTKATDASTLTPILADSFAITPATLPPRMAATVDRHSLLMRHHTPYHKHRNTLRAQ